MGFGPQALADKTGELGFVSGFRVQGFWFPVKAILSMIISNRGFILTKM